MENRIRSRRIDLTGFKIGLLTVQSFSHNGEYERTSRKPQIIPIWNCLCECGVTIQATSKRIKGGEKLHCSSLECKRVLRLRKYKMKLEEIRNKYESSNSL